MKEKIVELRKKGYSMNEISKELNCAKSTVSYHLNNVNLGGKINYDILNVDPDLLNQIIIMRKELKTYNEILDVVDISKDYLKKICRRLGLTKLNKKIKREDIDEYYIKCGLIKLCAEHFNVGTFYIKNHISDGLIINKRTKNINKSEAVINWRKRKKIEMVEYKGGKCEICGYDKSYRVLQFHHISPEGKDFNISGKSYSIEKIKTEVDKCILVCANCHIEIHEKIDKENAGNA